jgi:hypothetical protein
MQYEDHVRRCKATNMEPLSHRQWTKRTFEGERWKRGWDDASAALIGLLFVAIYIWLNWP